MKLPSLISDHERLGRAWLKKIVPLSLHDAQEFGLKQDLALDRPVLDQ